MKHDDTAKRYKDWYARLLCLYPRSYQRQFAEPMQQTFGDLCNECKQSGESMFGFALKAYADTGIGIIKERVKEIIMNIKTSKSKLFIAVGSVGLLAVILISNLLNNRQPAIIPPLSSFEQARKSSQGMKDDCLENDQKAVAAVRKDDRAFDETNGFSKFDITASNGMRDVPAGTNYELTINTYDSKIAKGTILYEQDYGTYNYTVKKLSGAGEWEFMSMVACSKA